MRPNQNGFMDTQEAVCHQSPLKAPAFNRTPPYTEEVLIAKGIRGEGSLPSYLLDNGKVIGTWMLGAAVQ